MRKPRQRLQASVLRIHRWLSLAGMLFWLAQALSGVLIVFHWEIEDALITGAYRNTDPPTIESRLGELAPPETGWVIESLWTSGSGQNRYDVYLENPVNSRERTVRIDGAGNILRTLDAGESTILETLVGFHHDLLAGEIGSWIVGISGLLLASNIGLAIFMAWPARRTLQALKPPAKTARGVAKAYGWHRAVGLWGASPALALVVAGVLLVFQDGGATLLAPTPTRTPTEGWTQKAGPGFASVLATARSLYPDAKLADVGFPTPDSAVWRVRLRTDGETRRAYGRTTIYISGNNGKILANVPASSAEPARAFLDGLFPFHTGEIAGLPGRLAVLATGFWLLTISTLGLTLWVKRRRSR